MNLSPALNSSFGAPFAAGEWLLALVPWLIMFAFGGWDAAQKTHFSDGGTFDQIYRPGGR